jgi:uncharacterized membrane protein YidH (DUF202 family)
VLGIIAFGLALALLIMHFVDRSVPLTYAVAAFIMATIVVAGDLKETAGEVCTVANATRTCTYAYTVKFESLAALIASVGFAMLTLAIYLFNRLGRTAAGGWAV